MTRGLKEDKHPNWKGGRSKHSEGYIQLKKPKHHFAGVRGYVMEHRFIWEQHNNAMLLPWATVHHINHEKKDNRIENLEVFIRGKHSDLHLKEKRDNEISKRKCCYCGGGTRLRIRHCRGYVYYYSDWNRNPLNRSEWLCSKCYLNQWYGRKHKSLWNIPSD